LVQTKIGERIKMRKWMVGGFSCIVLFVGYGLFQFYKKPSDTRDEKAAFVLSATELSNEFSDDETGASKKFADKIVIVSGKASEIRSDSAALTLTLSTDDPLSGVICSFYPDESANMRKLKPGDRVSIKGKCTGKLMDVVLNNCRIVKEN
jgi:hypothetical protein